MTLKEPTGLIGVTATDLLGRGADLGLLAGFLRGAAAHGGSLIIAGAPGLGKSALVRAAADAAEAHGVTVVRATGIEFLLDMSFSSLKALLQPLAHHLDELQPLQQRTIASMLGHEPDAESDVLLRYKAVLDLLRLAADERPLLLVVDDLHWVDRASAALLGFVARRLDGTRVGLLGALRTGDDTCFGREGLPVHELQPLAEPAAATLVSTRYPTLDVRATRRVLAEAQGNPLALIELPQALAASVKRDAAPGTAAVMPLSRRLHDLYAGRVQALPDTTRRLLLLAALDGTGDVLVMTQAGGSAGLPDLAPAEAAGLVVVDPDGRRLSFRHPLIRSTVVQGASADLLRSSHRALAGVLKDDTVRSAHHLAHAADGPDEAVAELLERSADEMLRRGDAMGAFVTLLGAADLSAAAEGRGRRLAAAAYVGADVAGELRTAAELLVEARRADPSLRGSLRAAVAAGHVLLNVDGHIGMAHRLLAGALQEDAAAPGDHSDGREEALLLLLELCLFAGRPDLWQSCQALLARFPGALPPYLHALADLVADPDGVTAEHVRVVELACSGLHTESDPRVIEQVSTAASFLDRGGLCRDALWRVVRDGRSGGAVASAIGAMTTLTRDAYSSGQWEQCDALIEEGVRLCAQHGYDLRRWPFLFAQAKLCAARGDTATVRRLAAEIDAWARPRGMVAVSAHARQAEVLAALGAGDADRAYAAACAVCEPGTLPVGLPQALSVTLDLVVAAMASGHVEQARRHVEVVRTAGITRHAPHLRLLAAASAAVVAEAEQAEAMYCSALALPEVALWPFDTARVQLLLGEHLHRRHGGSAGREPLAEAHATLRRLGADPWTARAASALRTAGAPVAGFTAPTPLSDTEYEIARLAASGMSNKQIGGQLYLSHRTIGAHLYRIFPKLGITTRAALRDALAGHQPLPAYAAD